MRTEREGEKEGGRKKEVNKAGNCSITFLSNIDFNYTFYHDLFRAFFYFVLAFGFMKIDNMKIEENRSRERERERGI